MTRRKLLKDLYLMWSKEASLNTPIEIIDLVDDCAVLGIEGANEAYLKLLRSRTLTK